MFFKRLTALFAAFSLAACVTPVETAFAAPSKNGVKRICPDGTLVPIKKDCPTGNPPPPPDTTPPPPAPYLAVSDVTISESGGSAVVTVTKTGTSTLDTTVNYSTGNVTATAGNDYTATSGVLTIGPGATTATFSVPIINDTVNESDETVNVTLSNPVNGQFGDSSGTITILDDDVVTQPPPTPPPSPDPAGDILSPGGLNGIVGAVVTDHDYTLDISAGGGAIPPSAGTDPVGAFRMVCGPNHVNYDDMIVYPGVAGGSMHLHDYNSNKGTNYNSTFTTMLNSGGSTCNDYGDGTKASQRSGYWIPALLLGNQYVIRPDRIIVYYKNFPSTSPHCGYPGTLDPNGSGIHAEGICVPMPNGIRIINGSTFVAGQYAPNAGNTNNGIYFFCASDGKSYKTITDYAAGSPTCKELEINSASPPCWDGKYLWKTDRSHLASKSYGNWGYSRCPADHPYLIPQVSQKYNYTVTNPADGSLLDKSLLKLSCDDMDPSQPRGWCKHVDMVIVWDSRVMKIWQDNCIEKRLSCNAGQLGDGRTLRNTATITVPNPNRLIPIPVHP